MACCGVQNLKHNKVRDYDDDELDVLIIGLEGAGKTLLIRRLQSLHNPSRKVNPQTFPTSGTETNEIACQPHPRFSKIWAREVGGCMAPIWYKYYEECRSVLFVIDATNGQAAQAAAGQLQALLPHESLKGKPCLLVLNKIDATNALPRSELDSLIGLPKLMDTCTGRFDVLEVSALEGKNDWAVLAWLVESKLSRQSKPQPS
ncbi:ADP-ribosylation factor family-domain-containing protein [Dunaliella salina]|uniref:ADP-ribosylation factor family-domain-containing protein n=1 Tax=Dunaliella salina TaxID=3046 RepID=A0ABQ7G9U0_DUNSA|nr:ADP-ribosylation factor family-domain-containing protein [Dunaliella salina]|eukprot:KAF5831372.1 ADP-ribosylation factor family-domain-containing protein [Dunaliella salina]